METVVVNEAIREYLEYNSYHHTLSVFLAESGQGKQTQFDKKLLLDELRLDASETQNLPCLYSLVRVRCIYNYIIELILKMNNVQQS